MMDILAAVLGVGVAVVCFTSPAFAAISCKDEGARDVDWFVIYKYPRIETHTDPAIRHGLGYTYLDNHSVAWREGVAWLNDTQGALQYTLQQIYDNPGSDDVAYVMYNDATPEKKTSMAHAHAKGDVIFDAETGLWLVHSLPRFPYYAEKYYRYPWSGIYFGQIFLCMTMGAEHFNSIGQQLQYSHPQIYDYNLPASFRELAPDMAQVVLSDSHVKKAPWWYSAEMTTLGGQTFKSFVKYSKFGKDLYDDLVAEKLSSPMYVATWLRGGPKYIMPSNCSIPYPVYNVKDISVNGVEFNEYEDHSKWAITTTPQRPWVCIGDINRMYSQRRRGGGVVCTEHLAMWNTFRKAILSIEQCGDEVTQE